MGSGFDHLSNYDMVLLWVAGLPCMKSWKLVYISLYYKLLYIMLILSKFDIRVCSGIIVYGVTETFGKESKIVLDF